jgi:membrane protease YdiL (CAAX protease family)
LIPPDSADPTNGTGRPDAANLDSDSPRPPSPAAGPPGTSTFTIEGRAAPGLFVVGWLATISGAAISVISFLAGPTVAPVLLLVGLVILSIGLIAGAGAQGIERRARGDLAYEGPSPYLVFAAAIPVSLLAVVAVGIPIGLAGFDVLGPVGRLASVIVQALMYVAVIRLLVTGPGALTWRDMGIHPFGGRALSELVGGALWALPVIVATIPIAVVLSLLLQQTPQSPLPPTGEDTGFLLQFLAGAIVAPIGEEVMFRGFATTAWARALGRRRAIVQGALFFAFIHVLGVSGTNAPAAVSLAVIAFATRIPVGLALGWLFLRSGSIWTPIGLHAAFNATLLIVAEVAIRGAGSGG